MSRLNFLRCVIYAQAAACHTTIRIILGTGVVHTAYVQHAKHFNKWQRVRIFDGWRAVGPPIYEARPAIRYPQRAASSSAVESIHHRAARERSISDMDRHRAARYTYLSTAN